MSYKYEEQRPYLLTDDGQRKLLQVRDHVAEMLKQAGAFQLGRAINAVSGDNWIAIACVDRLVELGEIREIQQGDGVAGQHRVFVRQ